MKYFSYISYLNDTQDGFPFNTYGSYSLVWPWFSSYSGSLQLLCEYTMIACNGVQLPLEAIGGVIPYTYSVLPGGPGGSIDATTGLYTSPYNATGKETIQVTDLVGDTQTYSFYVNYPLSLVADIIQTSLGLNPGQVYLWDQKIDIPIDSNLYVAIGVDSCKPFGNRIKYESAGSNLGLNGIQSVNMYAILSIDILSRGPIARDMKEMVLLSLSSVYAQQQMELNSFFVAPLSIGFVNLSQIDGAAIPYRFRITVGLQYFSTLTTSVGYYDSYQAASIIVND